MAETFETVRCCLPTCPWWTTRRNDREALERLRAHAAIEHPDIPLSAFYPGATIGRTTGRDNLQR